MSEAGSGSVKLNIPACIWVAAALLLPVIVLGPAMLYGMNAGEFTSSLPALLARLIPTALVGIAALSLMLRAFPARARIVAVGVCLALAMAFYLQGNVLVRDYGQFNGNGIDWPDHYWQGIADIVVWTALFITGIVARRGLARNATAIAATIITFQLVLTTLALYGKEHVWASGYKHENVSRVFDFSSKSNAVVIVLDAFKSPLFERWLKRHPRWARDFDGFTLFDNATTGLTTTYMSVPAILTGRVYHNVGTVDTILDGPLAHDAVMDEMVANGFESDLVTLDRYCERLSTGTCHTPEQVVAGDTSALAFVETLRLADLSLFRFSPQFAKRGMFTPGQLALERAFAPVPKGLNWHLSQAIALTNSFSEHSRLAGTKPRFKFIHLMVPHRPFQLDAKCEAIPEEKRETMDEEKRFYEQAECAVRLTRRLLDTMRSIGAYDDSSIIVVADHGLAPREYYDSAREFVDKGLGRVLPLLLVKPRGAHGPIRHSRAPAMNVDVAHTISELSGIESRLPGRDVMQLGEDEQRDRHYYHYVFHRNTWGNAYLPPIQEFIVNGDPHKAADWRMGRDFPPGGKADESLAHDQ